MDSESVEAVKENMDTQYIKMCDCPEIQGQAKNKSGDYFAVDGEVGVFVEQESFIFCLDGFNGCYGEKEVWLPIQAQLQEIWLNHPEKHPDDMLFENKIDEFIYWLWGNSFRIDYFTPQYDKFNSMEQLWLAFVMKKIYNKTWNGEKWIG